MEIDIVGIGIRHYSLIGDPLDRSKWQIAVRLADETLAEASAHLHRKTKVGDEFHVIAPKNNFSFTLPSKGESLHLIAGGIGITPMLSMVDAAEEAGADWSLTYFGRTVESMPFRDRLAAHGARVSVVPSAHRAAGAIDSLLGTATPGGRVYTCGPEALIDEAAECSARRAGRSAPTAGHRTRSECSGGPDGALRRAFGAGAVGGFCTAGLAAGSAPSPAAVHGARRRASAAVGRERGATVDR